MQKYNNSKSGTPLPCMKYCTNAFTMTEILVIIIIICLLAGFLMSTLAQSLKRSKQTVSQHHLQSINCTVRLYYSGKSNRQ